MLELVHAAHDLFADTRSFVFVAELGESTQLFEGQPADAALAAIYGGGVVSLAHNSNYRTRARGLRGRPGPTRRPPHHGRDPRRRSNELPRGRRGRDREAPRAGASRSVDLSRGAGDVGSGGSAMLRLAAVASKVVVARTALELEVAARDIVARR